MNSRDFLKLVGPTLKLPSKRIVASNLVGRPAFVTANRQDFSQWTPLKFPRHLQK